MCERAVLTNRPSLGLSPFRAMDCVAAEPVIEHVRATRWLPAMTGSEAVDDQGA
jgi:hypothetical protein